MSLFTQVDVFTTEPFRGNPVAVIHDATDLGSDEMRRIARWTNLSETTFLLPPTAVGADYRVRIFTPTEELPFAGHPTLGTCHAWLGAGGVPADEQQIVQQCEAGLITIRRTPAGLAFAAPPLRRSGPVDPATVAEIAAVLAIDASEIVASEWVDNGPGWVAVLLAEVERVLSINPGATDLKIGVAAMYPAGSAVDLEVRAFFPSAGAILEDPVTGSLNASLAQWLLGSGRLQAPYVAAQGTVLGREGRVHVSVADGETWIAGGTLTIVAGNLLRRPALTDDVLGKGDVLG